MLVRHVRRHHKEVYNNHLEAEADAKLVLGNDGDKQQSLKTFLTNCPKFESCLITWMVATYQPLSCCEDPSFQNMCFSLNQKAPIIGKDKLWTLLTEEYAITKNKLKMMLKGRYFSFTTDGWTSLANVG
jgi:hypothetical protein